MQDVGKNGKQKLELFLGDCMTIENNGSSYEKALGYLKERAILCTSLNSFKKSLKPKNLNLN